MKYKKHLIFIMTLIIFMCQGINKVYATKLHDYDIYIDETCKNNKTEVSCYYKSNDLSAIATFKCAPKGGNTSAGMALVVKGKVTVLDYKGEPGGTGKIYNTYEGWAPKLFKDGITAYPLRGSDLLKMKANYQNCPNYLVVGKHNFNAMIVIGEETAKDRANNYFDKGGAYGKNISLKDFQGIESCGGEECILGETVELVCNGSGKNSLFGDPNYAGTDGDDTDPPSTAYLINQILNIMRIIAVAAVMTLGTLDIAKAIIASKEDEMRKAQSTFIKRIVACIAIFLVPTFVKIIMNLSYDMWEKENYKTCSLEQINSPNNTSTSTNKCTKGDTKICNGTLSSQQCLRLINNGYTCDDNQSSQTSHTCICK